MSKRKICIIDEQHDFLGTEADLHINPNFSNLKRIVAKMEQPISEHNIPPSDTWPPHCVIMKMSDCKSKAMCADPKYLQMLKKLTDN